MELEVKHLAPYLPHGLKVAQHRNGKLEAYDLLGIKYTKSGNLVAYIDDSRHGAYMSSYFAGILPILRPMEDLVKEITVNGETFVPMVELLQHNHVSYFKSHQEGRYSLVDYAIEGCFARAWVKFIATVDIEINIDSLPNQPYWIIEALLSWHFDVNSLIPAGLAVDVSTITK